MGIATTGIISIFYCNPSEHWI